MERRKTPRKNWVIGKDEVGRSVLEWQADRHTANRQESDPLARTYNFLQRLEAPDLELLDDAGKVSVTADGCNPYDTGVYKVPKRDRR
jgi:hypothetical protein